MAPVSDREEGQQNEFPFCVTEDKLLTVQFFSTKEFEPFLILLMTA